MPVRHCSCCDNYSYYMWYMDVCNNNHIRFGFNCSIDLESKVQKHNTLVVIFLSFPILFCYPRERKCRYISIVPISCWKVLMFQTNSFSRHSMYHVWKNPWSACRCFQSSSSIYWRIVCMPIHSYGFNVTIPKMNQFFSLACSIILSG